MRDLYGIYLEPLGEKYYALIEDGSKILEIEFVQSQGAINLPNNMVADLFDIGFGGVVPFAASADQGSGVRIISPLHSRGDMLVVAADNQDVNDWESFSQWVRDREEPVVIGYKSPSAVALLLMESALTAEGLTWSMQGNPEPGSDVLLFNAQGQPNLNPALQNGTIQGYVSNNPACALAEHNGIGKCVAELSDLPPGDFMDHPCCAIASTEDLIAQRPDDVAAALRLFAAATEYINDYPDDAAETAAEWIGNPVEVEIVSMATSGYDMHLTDGWLANMEAILDNMRGLGAFTGPLSQGDGETDASVLYDFSLLPEDLR
jgi:NitT/TauT family transport system substrate-binding protein